MTSLASYVCRRSEASDSRNRSIRDSHRCREHKSHHIRIQTPLPTKTYFTLYNYCNKLTDFVSKCLRIKQSIRVECVWYYGNTDSAHELAGDLPQVTPHPADMGRYWPHSLRFF